MPSSPNEELSDARAELDSVCAALAALLASPVRDPVRVAALNQRARELRRRIDAAEHGLGPLREDGFYGSGL